MVPRRLLVRLWPPACLPWARFGGGRGAVLAGLFAARGTQYTGGAPAAVGRGAGGVVTWAVLVVWVGVSALRLSAEWQGHDAGTTASSVAAASHTLAAVASNAITTLQRIALFVATMHFSTADRLERSRGF
jgi:hypothetical protein